MANLMVFSEGDKLQRQERNVTAKIFGEMTLRESQDLMVLDHNAYASRFQYLRLHLTDREQHA